MKQLRRFRVLFAALAILLSPGGITPWLQLAHACGPEMAETSMAGMDHAAMAGHAGHQMPDTGDDAGPKDHLHHCICVGACASAAIAATTSRTTIAVIPAEFRAPVRRPLATVAQSDPQYAHPFAHAPPRIA
ncbi:MAG TPA: hypothetical protein VG817_10985 [Gemmatimonadales bacterium]|nr:hypothetical protein [Gemmatimonadales bacterium]